MLTDKAHLISDFGPLSMMEPQIIWIGIDPNLLIEGFDYIGFFGADSFLKFNIVSDETDSKDIEPGNTYNNSTNNLMTTNDLEQ